MSKPLSIIETHKAMLKVIPSDKKKLISDLTTFINKLEEEKRPAYYYTQKYVYTDYLHILLGHIPNKILTNRDPDWIWNCQEVFSSSYGS
jgi:GH25 family lysozyme M1 (1,4-beta-N-acetylmuramidase)